MKSIIRKQIVVFGIMVVFFVATLIGIWYGSTVMTAKQESVAAAKERLASYERNKRTFAEESVVLKKIEERIVAREADIITEATVPQLLSSLETLAQNSSVDFAITAVQTPVEKDEQKSLIIDFSGKGTYGQLMEFATTVMAQQYQVMYTNFSLRAVRTTTFVQGAPRVSVPENAEWQLLATVKILSF